MGYVLCGYRGSGDHWCEDQIRGLCKLIPEKPDIYSRQPEEDWRYGIGKLGGIFRSQPGAIPEQLEPGDRCITAELMDVRPLRRRQVKTVLWGWSPEGLTGAVLRKLRDYDAVVVTEQRSFRRLTQAGLRENLRMGPEPAFLVESICPANPLPTDTLGLSLSYPRETAPLLYYSYCSLIRWILKETSFHIALIPYCVQRSQNDLLLNRALYRQFQSSGRVLFREDADCRRLRGDFTQCHCCVGFSGAVAAWSCGIPALCLAGTNRILGLSRDLLGSCFEAVYPWQQLRSEEDLISRFRHFLTAEDRHRGFLGSAVKANAKIVV